MQLITYLLGSFCIMKSLFHISDSITQTLFDQKIIPLPIHKFEKINECIISSMHGILSTTLSTFAIQYPLIQSLSVPLLGLGSAPLLGFGASNDVHNQSLLGTTSTTTPTIYDNELQYFTVSFCFSYFLFDLFKCLYHRKYLFLVHHVCALVLLLSSMISFKNHENKGFYAMYFIFLLESNTVLLNIGFLLKEFKFHYSITCGCWMIHWFFFVLFRLIMIPKLLIIYYWNEGITPMNLIQLGNFAMILSGSVYWSYRQALGIQKYLKENSVI